MTPAAPHDCVKVNKYLVILQNLTLSFNLTFDNVS